MTPVRGKRGKFRHLTHDLRRTLCNKKCDGWVVETGDYEPCQECEHVATTN